MSPNTSHRRPRATAAVKRVVAAGRRLLSERGEASGVSRAAEALASYAALDADGQRAFFDALKHDFAPDPARVLAAATAYAGSPDSKRLAALSQAAEPPRQELLRRLNRAPGGTRAIVAMRERLLDLLPGDRELKQVDDDFHHLLQSWFNPGFLSMVRVDWHTPATLLEQLIRHEAVHEIRGWDDLRRRLQGDRRCFAFFHPALPDDPLIFVEVALVDTMPGAIAPLIDIATRPAPPSTFHTAVFYSISNCQPGLRGVSLGNFLIKQVAGVLAAEFPGLKRFCTLSPIPGFADWLARVDPARLPAPAAASLAALPAARPRDLARLCAAYLLGAGEADGVTRDPVARFHLNNGARLDRINRTADLSEKGLRQSRGMMVNYVYDLKAIERNHERFVHGVTEASRGVRALAG